MELVLTCTVPKCGTQRPPQDNEFFHNPGRSSNAYCFKCRTMTPHLVGLPKRQPTQPRTLQLRHR